MWDCPACGCQAIAPDLAFCPQCFTPRGEDMPKITTEGGPSNQFEDGTPETEDSTEVADTPSPDSKAAKAAAKTGTTSAAVTPPAGQGAPEPKPH